MQCAITYTLVFPHEHESRSGAIASVSRSPGDAVWGVVYEIPLTDLPGLYNPDFFFEFASDIFVAATPMAMSEPAI